MSSPSVASVNVGIARAIETKPLLVSAIDKLPVDGPVLAMDRSLQGDDVEPSSAQAGTARAVHAYASEDLDWWGAELGRPLRPGLFGENLTTRELDLNACVVGEQWLVGTARLQVTAAGTPNETLGRWLRIQGFAVPDWERRFVQRGRPGLFLSVLDRGWIAAGDPIEVIDRPTHGLTVQAMFRALTTDPALLPLLLEIDGLPLDVYDTAQAYVDSAG
jgi:MOSC domain-containing protein YiiM